MLVMTDERMDGQTLQQHNPRYALHRAVIKSAKLKLIS